MGKLAKAKAGIKPYTKMLSGTLAQGRSLPAGFGRKAPPAWPSKSQTVSDSSPSKRIGKVSPLKYPKTDRSVLKY